MILHSQQLPPIRWFAPWRKSLSAHRTLEFVADAKLSILRTRKSGSAARSVDSEPHYVDASTQTTPPPEESNLHPKTVPDPEAEKTKFVCTVCLSRGFTFLELPPEIRNMIYRYTFVSPQYIGNHCTLSKGFYQDLNKWRNLAFARTCRQIYQESSLIFFAENGFEFACQRSAVGFLKAIKHERRLLLTQIRFVFATSGFPYEPLVLIDACKSLKILEVQVRGTSYPDDKTCWIQNLRDAKNLVLGDSTEFDWQEPQHVALTGHRGRLDATPSWGVSMGLASRRGRMTSSIQDLQRQKQSNSDEEAAGRTPRIHPLLR